MDLEIQSRNVERDPAWRDLVEQQAGRLSERYPELLRLHVTVGHGRHHRAGAEVVALVANLEGATMRAEKQQADLTSAVRAAFRALATALERRHRQRFDVSRSDARARAED